MSVHAMIAEARGHYQEAEVGYRETEQRKASSIEAVQKLENRPSESSMRTGIDSAVLSQARMKARQGRLVEAEIDARRALLSRLKELGKDNAVTVNFIRGFPASSSNQKVDAAASIYADLDRAMQDWEPARREVFETNGSRITALYSSKRIEDGIHAFGKTGPVVFAATGLSSEALDAQVKRLRGALEPQAAMISDTPALDLSAAYALYRSLLGPVEAGWRPAKRLIVATNS